MFVLNAVLLKLRPKLYQSRYNLSAMNSKQDMIHRLQSSELSTPLPLGVISLAIGHLQSIDQCLKQDMIHTGTIPRTTNATTTGRDLVSYQCQYGHNESIDQCLKQDTIHPATILWIINDTTTGWDLVSYRCQYGH